jgi:hypothetical protein
MVKNSFYDDLLNCYKEGLKKLKHSKNLKEDNPFPDQEFNFSKYSIGNYWCKLQQNHLFLFEKHRKAVLNRSVRIALDALDL